MLLLVGHCSLGARPTCPLRRSGHHLEDVLAGSTSLQELALGWNALGSRGTAALAHGLLVNRALLRLDVARCGLGDAGAAALGAALRQNATLQARRRLQAAVTP